MSKLVYIISDAKSIDFKQKLKDVFPDNFTVIDIGLFDIAEQVEVKELVREIYEKMYEHKDSKGIIIDSENVDLCAMVREYEMLHPIDHIKAEGDFNVLCINSYLMDLNAATDFVKLKFNL